MDEIAKFQAETKERIDENSQNEKFKKLSDDARFKKLIL